MIKNYVWFKNKIIPKEDALISAFSPTAQFGLNVFEGIKAYWCGDINKLLIVELESHVNRLFNSAEIINFKIPLSKSQIKDAICSILQKNQVKEDIYIRLNAFIDGAGEKSWFHSDPVHLYIFLSSKPRKKLDSLSGASMNIVSHERISKKSMPPECKLGANYINSRYGQIEANKKGFDLPVFLNYQGNVSESAGSCIFIIKDNVLITPTTDCSILNSITRKVILEIAKKNNISTCEREVKKSELLNCNEIFLCGTTAEIIPVTNIDNKLVGDGKVGPLTKLLLSTYLDRVTKISELTTPVDIK